MWYEDLTRHDFLGRKQWTSLFGEENPPIPTAVGWLENGKPYTTGETSKTLCKKLYDFINTPGIYYGLLGRHECDLCSLKSDTSDFNYIDNFGSKTNLIAYRNKIYIFPDLIIHYINDHSYLPPAEFIEAVLTSTPQETIEYFTKIRENGIYKTK